MEQLFKLIQAFEERNNISISVELFGDGSSQIKEFWEEDILIETKSADETIEYLKATKYKLDENGSCLDPVQEVTPTESGESNESLNCTCGNPSMKRNGCCRNCGGEIEYTESGEGEEKSIDDMVDEWHDSESTAPLHEYLGMTWKEYKAWVINPPQNQL